MAYSEAAIARRRCTARTRAGAPCRAWACWDDPGRRCVVHAGRGHTGPQGPGLAPSRPTRYTPCRCIAYAWPHRPGSGLCRWPDPPTHRRTTPAGTHRAGSVRLRWRRSRRLAAGGYFAYEARDGR